MAPDKSSYEPGISFFIRLVSALDTVADFLSLRLRFRVFEVRR
jgi:hypothetical protein